MARNIRIGSRESRLAVVQAELVRSSILSHYPDYHVEIVTMKTTGDIILDRTLDKIGGKGLFVKELDKALLTGYVDICVHSFKDIPMEVPEALPIVAVGKREYPFDVLVLPNNTTEISELPFGCSSARRATQLESLFPTKMVKSVRGNIITRLEKLDNGEFSGLILAEAGLRRLGLEQRIYRTFTLQEMIPAACQGMLAVQARWGEDTSYLAAFHDAQTALVAKAERAFVRTLNGGCSVPIAAYAQLIGEDINITGFYVNSQGKFGRGTISGKQEKAKQLGEQLAIQLASSH